MEQGEIYYVSLDPSRGHEQQGTRPVVVISDVRFNLVTKVPIVLPITNHGVFARMAGFSVSLDTAGTKTTGIIRCDQPRALDLVARRARMAEIVPRAIIDEVLARLLPIFGI